MAAHQLTQAPPDTIAHYRSAKRLLDAEPETALRPFIGAEENVEMGTGASLPGAVHIVEFSAPLQPRFTRKSMAFCLRVRGGQQAPVAIRA